MKVKELKEELKKRGIEFDASMKKAELQALYDQSELKIKTVEESLSGKNDMLPEEIVKDGERTDLGVKRKSGIIIPNEVIAQMSKSQYRYVADCSSEACHVKKIDRRGVEHDVRIYSKDRHGDNFKELAIQFVDKNNR